MINGASSHSAIRGSFSIDNGDSSQNITFKIRVRNLFFGSKNQDCFQTFFQNNSFVFRDSRLLKSVIDKDLKKSRNNWFKLRHKKNISPFTTLFPGLENCWANFKRLCQELKTLCFSAFIPFWRNLKINIGEFPWSWLLGIVLRKKTLLLLIYFLHNTWN